MGRVELDPETLTATPALKWELVQSADGRAWLERAALYDDDDREEWLREQLSIGAGLTEEGTRIVGPHIAWSLRALTRALQECLREPW